MQIYTLEIRKPTLRFIGEQSAHNQIRIMSAIRGMPNAGNVTPMKGQSGYRLRVGSYRVIRVGSNRVIFDRDDVNMIVTVTRVGNRGDVYK